MARFPEVRSARSLVIRVPVYNVEFPIELNPAHNDFEINGAAITQVRFKEERLRIDGKTLELRFWDKDKAMRYVKP